MEKKNIRLFLRYARYRIGEILVWCGFPVIGALFAGAMADPEKLALFGAQMVCVTGHIITLNDWGGLKRNPGEIGRYGSGGPDGDALTDMLKNLSIASFVTQAIVGIFIVGWRLTFGFSCFGLALSVLYSHPATHLKEKLIGSKIIHFVGGQFLFFMGYLSFGGEAREALYLGTFFALILFGGHFIHEAIGINEDKGILRTWATVFGAKTTALTGWSCFLLAHVYWTVLFRIRAIQPEMFFLFSIPLLIHVTYPFIRNPWIYRILYRVSYGICALIYMIRSF